MRDKALLEAAPWHDPVPRTTPIDVTVCYVLKNQRVLLQLKALGRFGEGYLNGPGGKVQPGELPNEAICREVNEETGLRLEQVSAHGVMNFVFGVPETKRLVAHVFSSSRFSGTTRGRQEGRLRWYSVDRLPYNRMWADNRYWLPVVLAGGIVRGTCWHDMAGRHLLYCSAAVTWPGDPNTGEACPRSRSPSQEMDRAQSNPNIWTATAVE
jgi:8-oxo-dGTP diphosphatase